jgi:hypothetical protein
MLSQIVSLNRLRRYEQACREQAERASDDAASEELTKIGDAFKERLLAISESDGGD